MGCMQLQQREKGRAREGLDQPDGVRANLEAHFLLCAN